MDEVKKFLNLLGGYILGYITKEEYNRLLKKYDLVTFSQLVNLK